MEPFLLTFFCLCLSNFGTGWFITEFIEDRTIFSLLCSAIFTVFSIVLFILLHIIMMEMVR